MINGHNGVNACFDRFVADNDTAVIDFIDEDGNAAIFSALASTVLGKHPGDAVRRLEAKRQPSADDG